MAGILTALNADVLICGGIGGGAKAALAAANIKLYGSVSGNADDAVAALLDGNLAYNPNVERHFLIAGDDAVALKYPETENRFNSVL